MSAMIDHTRNPVWGRTLRAKVAETGLSQAAFANRHGFVSRTFNSWCNGRWPGEKTAREVAKAVGIEYDALISERPTGIDTEIMKTAITIVDSSAANMGLNLPSETRATLYALAYEYMATHHSRQELARHVSNLLALSGGKH